MEIFLWIGTAVVAFFVLGLLWGVMTDPARISEEEDEEVDAQSPAERQGFLRSHRRMSAKQREDRIAEMSKSGYGEGEVNDL